MQEIQVLVPDERVAEFYEMFGRWLAGADSTDAPGGGILSGWRDTEDDLALAKVVWGKLSDRAVAMFSVLIDSPEREFTGEQLASDLDIPNGKYGIAGVLAWPGRHCKAVGRHLPIGMVEGDPTTGAKYSMATDVAALFSKARDRR